MQYDAVIYLAGAAGLALPMVKRHPRPEEIGLRYGITFHFGWVFERRRVTGAVPADPPRCGEARPEDFDWVPAGDGVWVGTRKAIYRNISTRPEA